MTMRSWRSSFSASLPLLPTAFSCSSWCGKAFTPGVVTAVLVKVGDEVKAGTPLFRLDDRQLRGELAVKQAAIAESRSGLVRLEAEPRKEKIPVLAASVK